MPPMSLTGVVTKCGVMQKTATVTVSRFMMHPKTGKRILRSKKYLTHDEEHKLRVEDRVVIRNCPKISARKAFKLESILRSPQAEAEARLAETKERQAAARAQMDAVLNASPDGSLSSS